MKDLDIDPADFFPYTVAICDGEAINIYGCDDLMVGIMLVETQSHLSGCVQLWDDNTGVLVATATNPCRSGCQWYSARLYEQLPTSFTVPHSTAGTAACDSVEPSEA